MTRGRVFIVEDDLGIRDMLEMVLTSDDYEVAGSDGPAAVPLAFAFAPDLILLDLHLHQTDGEQVCRDIRATPELAQIPIVLMSADTKFMNVAESLPVDGVLAKPFALEDLFAIVAQWVGTASRDEHIA